MLRSPILRQIALFLVLGVRLQAPARDVTPREDLQRRENPQDRRERGPISLSHLRVTTLAKE